MKQRVIAVLNQKGGVGKTTTTINLATYLAKAGKKLLVVDADPQANATSGLGLDKERLSSTLCDVMKGKVSASKAVVKARFENLDILPTDARLASIETEMANRPDREQILKEQMASLTSYDYVIIDCPPSLGLLTVNILTAANQVLIPVQAEYYALEGLSQLLQVMQEVGRSLNPDLELLGVALTMYDKRNSLSGQVEAEIKKHFGEKVFNTMIPRNIRLAEAPSHGLPIAEYDRWSKGAKAYKNLSKEVIERG